MLRTSACTTSARGESARREGEDGIAAWPVNRTGAPEELNPLPTGVEGHAYGAGSLDTGTACNQNAGLACTAHVRCRNTRGSLAECDSNPNLLRWLRGGEGEHGVAGERQKQNASAWLRALRQPRFRRYLVASASRMTLRQRVAKRVAQSRPTRCQIHRCYGSPAGVQLGPPDTSRMDVTRRRGAAWPAIPCGPLPALLDLLSAALPLELVPAPVRPAAWDPEPVALPLPPAPDIVPVAD